MSDDIKELPGGFVYIHEGGCADNLLSKSKRVPNINLGILELKYNNSFITICRIDSSACFDYNYKETDKKFYIINIKRDTLYGPMIKSKFDSLAKKFNFPKDLKVR